MNKRKLDKRKVLIAILIVLAFISIIIYNITLDNKIIVCIDAGHGGSDVGAINEDTNRYEKDDNLKVAKQVKEELKKQDIKVVMTRNSDKKVDLRKRCNIANNKHADLFVSIHRNSSDTQADGVEIWVKSRDNEKNKVLANNILENLANQEIQTNRGVKEGTMQGTSSDYYVNENTNMPSCLIELGFISNKTDNKLLDKNTKEYAKAIADGIIQTLEDLDITK